LNPVRKARRAGALYEGREPGVPQRNPEVRRWMRCEAFLVEGREGDLRRGEDVSGGWGEGEPERLEGPGEQEAPTRGKHSGVQKGVRLFRGDQAAEAPMRGREVSQGSAGAERGRETFLRSLERRKALKGEAQERRELKEASTG